MAGLEAECREMLSGTWSNPDDEGTPLIEEQSARFLEVSKRRQAALERYMNSADQVRLALRS